MTAYPTYVQDLTHRVQIHQTVGFFDNSDVFWQFGIIPALVLISLLFIYGFYD